MLRKQSKGGRARRKGSADIGAVCSKKRVSGGKLTLSDENASSVNRFTVHARLIRERGETGGLRERLRRPLTLGAVQ